MPRMARVVMAGIPLHVTQRGHRREDVFFGDADRQRYLELLHGYAEMNGLKITAYCLMTNHVHLVVTPKTQTSLARTLKPVHMRYAQHVNWTHKLSGRLWQGRYFSCPLDDSHCLAAMRYVECNPVRAGLAAKAEDYPWSSAAGHVGRRADPLLSAGMREESGIRDWTAWLSENEPDEAIDQLRLCTRTGRPLGDVTFIDRLERLCGRILRPRPGRRPDKTHLGTELG